jgi:hypothetical protein
MLGFVMFRDSSINHITGLNLVVGCIKLEKRTRQRESPELKLLSHKQELR